METKKIYVYTKEELMKSREKACKVLEELEGKSLTSFGEFRVSEAKNTIARLDKWLALDLDLYYEHKNELVTFEIKTIKL